MLTRKKTQATYSLRAGDIRREWHVIDASEQAIGRVATRAASLLRGKHKPAFAPHLDAGDAVIVVNADRIRITGGKEEKKVYYRHSQYPGGLKSVTLGTLMASRPVRVVEMAVRGMLPHNRLGRQMYRHLHVYAGPDHPHAGQVGPAKTQDAASPQGPADGEKE